MLILRSWGYTDRSKSSGRNPLEKRTMIEAAAASVGIPVSGPLAVRVLFFILLLLLLLLSLHPSDIYFLNVMCSTKQPTAQRERIMHANVPASYLTASGPDPSRCQYASLLAVFSLIFFLHDRSTRASPTQKESLSTHPHSHSPARSPRVEYVTSSLHFDRLVLTS